MKKQRLILIISLLALATMPEIALAGPFDTWGQKILDVFSNTLLRAIASVALIGMFITAAAGKMPWEWFIRISLCIFGMFSVASIVDFFV